MPDVLIRNVPADHLARIDEAARRLGLSRSDFLRRRLRMEAEVSASAVSVTDLAELSRLTADLADPEVMGEAWS